MKRFLLIGGGIGAVIVLAIIGAVIYGFLNLEGLIIQAVESIGSDATKAKVTLNKVDISLTSGKGALRGLTVGNPAGFKTEKAFGLGEVSVTIDTGSVGQDPVVIKEIVIAAPQVTYELGDRGSNIDAILKNVKSFAGSTGGGKSAAPKPAGETSDGPKLVIENVYVRDGQVSVSATALGGRKLGAKLPTLRLRNIGKKQGGATPAQVAAQIIAAIGNGSVKAVGTLNLDKILKGLPGKALKGVEKRATGAVGKALGTGTKGASEAKDAVKKLFGK